MTLHISDVVDPDVHLPMDEISNGNITGSITGLLTNVATLSLGMRGKALHLNGMDQYVNYGSQLDDTCARNVELCSGNFTLSAWIRTYVSSTGSAMTDGGGAQASIGFMISVKENNMCKVQIRSPSQQWMTEVPVPAGNWTHLTVQWSETNGMDVFKDGCLAKHTDAEERSRAYSTTSLQHFTMGTPSGANSHGTNQVRVDIDEVKMWFGGLTTDQIWHDYLRTYV